MTTYSYDYMPKKWLYRDIILIFSAGMLIMFTIIISNCVLFFAPPAALSVVFLFLCE